MSFFVIKKLEDNLFAVIFFSSLTRQPISDLELIRFGLFMPLTNKSLNQKLKKFEGALSVRIRYGCSNIR